jgi:hypothetical protein
MCGGAFPPPDIIHEHVARHCHFFLVVLGENLILVYVIEDRPSVIELVRDTWVKWMFLCGICLGQSNSGKSSCFAQEVQDKVKIH